MKVLHGPTSQLFRVSQPQANLQLLVDKMGGLPKLIHDFNPVGISERWQVKESLDQAIAAIGCAQIVHIFDPLKRTQFSK